MAAVVIVGATAFAGCFGAPPPPPINLPPSAFPATSTSIATAGDQVPFTATGADLDGQIATWNWSFGDGKNALGQNVNHVYDHQGTYYVTLNVTDDKGASFDTLTQGLSTPIKVQVLSNFQKDTPEDQPLAQLTLWSATSVIQPNASLTWSAAGSAGSWNSEATNPGTLTSFAMDFGDGSAVVSHTQAELTAGTWDGNVTHQYTTVGQYAANLKVTSNGSRTDTAYWTVLVAATVPTPGGVKNPDTLVIETFGQPEFLDPAVAYDDGSGQIIQAVYETLVTYDGAAVDRFVPLLAESIPTAGNGISADNMNYTFHIRQGIKFASGNDLKADDVVYSINRVLQINDPGSAAWILEQVLDLNSTVKDNDYQVTFHLTRPYGAFVSMLAYTVAAIVSKTTVEANGGVQAGHQNTWMNQHMDGTGPFVLKSWVDAQQIVLDRNDNYWNASAKAKVAHVIIKYVTEFSTRLLSLRSGNADIIQVPGVYRPDVQALDAVAAEQITVASGASTWSITTGAFNYALNVSQRSAMGTVDSPDNVPSDFFTDAHMRKAFALAFDYDDYVTNVAKGLAFRLSGIIPKGMYGFNDGLAVPTYNLQAAKDEFNMTKWATNSTYNPGGYAGGFNLTIGYNSGNTNRQKAAEILKRGVEALAPNIHINVVGWEWATYLSLTLHTASGSPGPVGLFFIGWGPDYADPDDYMVPFAQTGGTYPAFTGYSNASVDTMITQAGSIPNSPARSSLYDQIQTSVINDNVYILLTEAKNFHVAKDWVKGWYFNPMLSGNDLGGNMAVISKS